MSELSATQNQVLVILAEECNEVIHVVCKTLRFGLSSWHPNQEKIENPITNRDILISEIGDVLAMIDLAMEHFDLPSKAIHEAKSKKLKKLERYSDIFKDS